MNFGRHFSCLIAGIALVVVSRGFIFISAPLFLSSFVLSIVAMAKHHIAGGMITMISLCILPPICILRAYQDRQKVEDNKSAVANVGP